MSFVLTQIYSSDATPKIFDMAHKYYACVSLILWIDIPLGFMFACYELQNNQMLIENIVSQAS